MRNLGDLSNVEEYSDFKRPTGGFVIKIKAVEDVPEKEYLVVEYDISEAHEEADKKYIGVYEKRKNEYGYDFPKTFVSYKETAQPWFKAFCTSIRKSNDGYDFTKTYNEKELVGKVVGAVIADEEYMGKDKNGYPKVKIRNAVTKFRTAQAIREGDFYVPEFKRLEETRQKVEDNPFKKRKVESSEGFAALSDDDCPF